MAGAVDRHGEDLLAVGDLLGGRRPIVPGGFRAGNFDAGLLEQRLVDEAAGQGQLRHEAGDGVRAVGTHPVGLGAEIVLPVFRVGEVGPKIEPVLGRRLQIGDAGDIRPLPGFELHRQLFLDDVVGDFVEDDVDVGIGLREAASRSLMTSPSPPSEYHMMRTSPAWAATEPRELQQKPRRSISFWSFSPPLVDQFLRPAGPPCQTRRLRGRAPRLPARYLQMYRVSPHRTSPSGRSVRPSAARCRRLRRRPGHNPDRSRSMRPLRRGSAERRRNAPACVKR